MTDSDTLCRECGGSDEAGHATDCGIGWFQDALDRGDYDIPEGEGDWEWEP